MSSLEPDGGFLEPDTPAGDAASTGQSSADASGDSPRLPSLWAAFRDHYTRARERRHLNAAGEWVAQDEEFAGPLPLHPWECRGA